MNTSTLTADDGHQLDCYISEPTGNPVAGIVLLPEIFGITQHMQDMADEYAKRGYRAIVPALFDRVEPGAKPAYDEIKRGIELMKRCADEMALLDIKSAADAVSVDGKVAVQGYCWGGSLAFLSACELDVTAAVSFYGGNIINQLDRNPKCPVMFHFGDQDKSIPQESVNDIIATWVSESQHIAHIYQGADHAFANHDRTTFKQQAAELANQRSHEFLSKMMGG